MKLIPMVFLAPFVLVLTSITANAYDCADTFYWQQYECNDGQGCQSSIVVTLPNYSFSGVMVQCTSRDCCGELFTTCYGGASCNIGELRNPEFREELNEMAATAEILVRDCQGRYVPLSTLTAQLAAPPRLSHRPGRGSFMDEHLWR